MLFCTEHVILYYSVHNMIMVEMLACWLKNDRAPRLIPSKDLLSRVKDGNKLCARVEVAAGQVGQLLVRVRLHLLLMDGPIFSGRETK